MGRPSNWDRLVHIFDNSDKFDKRGYDYEEFREVLHEIRRFNNEYLSPDNPMGSLEPLPDEIFDEEVRFALWLLE